MATKPVHEFTRANIPIINAYCGLDISPKSKPGSLGPTSAWTPTPWPSTTTWPSTTKLPPTTLEFEKPTGEFFVNVNTTKIVLNATTAKAESSTESSATDKYPKDTGITTVSNIVNHSEEVNGLKTLIIYLFLIVNRLIWLFSFIQYKIF